MTKFERRTFLMATGAAATAAISKANLQAAVDPTSKVVVAVVGTGGMGGGHVQELARRKDVQVASVCDGDANRLAINAKAVESGSGKAPKVEKDLRKVLDDKSVDAVFIATPDHWHAPAAILALDAGKHV